MTCAPVSDLPLPSETPPEDWRRTDPLGFVAQGITGLAKLVLPLVAAFVATDLSELPLGLALPIVLAILAVNFAAAYLAWIRLRYRIGADDIRVEQGLISRSARAVPYDRIQDVSLEEKLVPRLLGLVEVRFETGAGGKDELHLAYVSKSEGERLREVVRERMDEGTAPAASDPADTQAERALTGRPLFAMGPARLVNFGLFEFSLVIFAVLIGAAQQFEFLLPFDVWDWLASQAEGQNIREAGGYIYGLGLAAQIAGVLYAVFVIIVLGVGTGVVRTLIRDWDFRLDETPKGFRRRRGLFTRTDVVMPVHRVQALRLTTGWLRRRFGWHGLSFVSLAQDAGAANHDVAPFAKMEEIAPIARVAGFTLPDEATDWRRPSPRYRLDKALLSGGLCLAGALAFGIVKIAWPNSIGLGTGVIILLLCALFFALQQAFLWRYDRYALMPHQVMARTGWLAPKLAIAPRVKLQSVEICAGPIAQRRGYADVIFGLAGGTFTMHGLRLEDAKHLRAAVLDSIAAVDFSELASQKPA